MITAAEFRPASELPQSTLTREDELEGIINDQAAQLEALRHGPMSAPRGQAPASLDVLAKMAELLQQNNELTEKLSKQERQIEKLVKDNEDLQRKIYEVHEIAKTVIKDLSVRLLSMEDKHSERKTDTNRDHLNRLAQVLLLKARQGQKGVTYKEAAQILKLDKSRICQLRVLIGSDSRFNISWHPNRSNMKIICLKNIK